ARGGDEVDLRAVRYFAVDALDGAGVNPGMPGKKRLGPARLENYGRHVSNQKATNYSSSFSTRARIVCAGITSYPFAVRVPRPRKSPRALKTTPGAVNVEREASRKTFGHSALPLTSVRV